MAGKQQPSSERKGKLINSSWKGRSYTRMSPETIYNPKTEAQQAHRNAFATLSRLASYMKEGHRVGLNYQAVRMRLDTYSTFKKLNSGLVSADRIDYQHLFLSKGPVTVVRITGVRQEGQVLRITFDDRYATKDENLHNLYLFAYCANLCKGILFGPVLRCDGIITGTIPTEWNGLQLHLYVFLIDPKGRSSDTIYVPFDELNVAE